MHYDCRQSLLQELDKPQYVYAQGGVGPGQVPYVALQTDGALESLSQILHGVGQCALMLLLQSLTCWVANVTKQKFLRLFRYLSFGK